MTLFGAYQMYKVVEAGGVTGLEWVFLALFVINFSWIALAFFTAILGVVHLIRFGIDVKPVLPERLQERTAIVMPIYNESPHGSLAPWRPLPVMC